MKAVAEKFNTSKQSLPISAEQSAPYSALPSNIPSEIIEIIKSAKKWQDLRAYKSLAEKYIPNLDDKLIKQIWEKYH